VRGKLRNALDASDLTQDTLLAAERGKDGKTFAGRGALRAWLRVILRNVAAQHARRRGFHVVPEALSSSLPGQLTSSGSDETARESQHRVQSMLQHLSERNRKIVLLRVAENLRFAEIGERLGMSETNARVVFNRAVRGLREREERAHDT
jgi:RNA polymerase sigma-70 factor (ECF subfamily)